MKTLIICDDDDIIKKISNGMKSCGYDTIVYHWLLKALDNVEEIDPDLIVINASDYPRHWKTFISYTTTWKCGSGENMPRVILFAKEDFGDDEKQKAKALGVSSILQYDGDDDKFLEQLQIATLSDDMGIADSENIEEELIEEEINEEIADEIAEEELGAELIEDEIIDEADAAPAVISENDETIAEELTEEEFIEDEIGNEIPEEIFDEEEISTVKEETVTREEEIIKQPVFDDDIPTSLEDEFETEEIFDSAEADNIEVADESAETESIEEEIFDDESVDSENIEAEISDYESAETESVEDTVAKDETLEYEDNIEETAAVTEIFQDIKYNAGSMILTNPVSGVFVTGSIVSISGDEKTIVFEPDMPSEMSEMHRDDTVNSLSLKTSKGLKMCRATIADTDGTHFTFHVA